jgi:hypothetical protein
MCLKQIRRWLRKHPVYSVLAGFFFFAFITLPPYLADTWALFSDRPLLTYIEEEVGVRVPSFSAGWVTVPVGLAGILAIIGLLVTGRRDDIARAEHERIVGGLDTRIAELARKLQEEEMDSKELGDFKKTYEWLHTISQNQKNSINRYVRVIECEIKNHDFVEELYVDFKFTIMNVSVYTVRIEDSVAGDIKLDSRLLSKGVKMRDNEALHCQNNEVKSFVVRQWLDRDEIADILRATDGDRQFRLHGLDIMVSGDVYSDIEIGPRRLEVYGLKVSSRPLRELSQKLQIEIRRADLRGYWIHSEPQQIGSQINMLVSVQNPRIVDVEVREVRLMVNAGGKSHTQSAEEGEIHEVHQVGESGEVKRMDPRLENLNVRPLVIGKGEGIGDGWFKFIFTDLPPTRSETYGARLTVVDSKGEEHAAEFSLKYE